MLTACSSGRDDLVTFEPVREQVELVSYTSSAMGGITFSMDPDHFLITPGDMTVISITDPAAEDGWETATIGLMTQTADGSRIESVEEVLRLTADTPTAKVTPTDTVLELFGYELDGYRIRADASQRDVLLYAADRYGAPPSGLYSFFPNAEVFLADTPAGVLLATRGEADDEANLDRIGTALGTLVASIKLTGPGLDEPLPDGQAIEPTGGVVKAGRGPVDDDGPTALDAPFSPIEPGTYQVANFGRTFTLDIDESWFVQPNFPGFVVLTAAGSGGPGDRDLVFVSGVAELVPVAGGPIEAGPRVRLSNVDQLLDSTPPGLDITGVEKVDLGGVTATRFDVTIDPDAECTLAEPCEYAIVTSSGVVNQLESTHAHRIWWIDGGPEGPSMIMARAALPAPFIVTATELLDTIRFS